MATVYDSVDTVLGLAPSLILNGARLFTAVGALLAVASARSNVRYAVLTADGLHVRLYTYGLLFGVVSGTGGGGLGAARAAVHLRAAVWRGEGDGGGRGGGGCTCGCAPMGCCLAW
jgi:hypothetical protein